MTPILLRLGGLVLLWRVSRFRPASKAELARAMDRLAPEARQRLLWRIVKDGRAPLPARVVSALPALYMVSPIDIVPDVIPVVGRVDDNLIFGATSNLLLRLMPPATLERHLAEARYG
jgi:uncharacterized membrane protein YkvA (DUF1232 family)